jgi:hypothetical protein
MIKTHQFSYNEKKQLIIIIFFLRLYFQIAAIYNLNEANNDKNLLEYYQKQ